MPSLLERIEANASARLPLPPGRKPTEELVRYRNFLKVETHRLKILHRAGVLSLRTWQTQEGLDPELEA